MCLLWAFHPSIELGIGYRYTLAFMLPVPERGLFIPLRNNGGERGTSAKGGRGGGSWSELQRSSLYLGHLGIWGLKWLFFLSGCNICCVCWDQNVAL